MTTLSLHAPAQPKILTWAHDAFVRAIAVVRAVFEVYAEAQEMARKADKRYPFTYWC